MGQYWKPVNLDKKEFLDPHALGDGLKLVEQITSNSGGGVQVALMILLAAMPERRGGGDLQQPDPFIGRWAGDRIAMVGDYARQGDIPGCPINERWLYAATCGDVYENIGGQVWVENRGGKPDVQGYKLVLPMFTDVTEDVKEIILREFGGAYKGGIYDPNAAED
jgi:hypothetical protein